MCPVDLHPLPFQNENDCQGTPRVSCSSWQSQAVYSCTITGNADDPCCLDAPMLPMSPQSQAGHAGGEAGGGGALANCAIAPSLTALVTAAAVTLQELPCHGTAKLDMLQEKLAELENYLGLQVRVQREYEERLHGTAITILSMPAAGEDPAPGAP